MKKLLFGAALLAGALALPAPLRADCISTINGPLCPPPNGGLASDMNGRWLCGPGQCVRNQNGAVKCATLPGGDALLDSSGQALCVGGCVDGDPAACAVPKK